MKKVIVIGLLMTAVAGVIAGPGWLDEHPKAATGLAAGGMVVMVGLALIVGVFIGAVWTARTMQAGANVAVSAQKVNDEWDARKTAAFAGLVREGAVIGRQASAALPSGAPLPLPGQGAQMILPPLAEFRQGPAARDWQVVDGESEVR